MSFQTTGLTESSAARLASCGARERGNGNGGRDEQDNIAGSDGGAAGTPLQSLRERLEEELSQEEDRHPRKK